MRVRKGLWGMLMALGCLQASSGIAANSSDGDAIKRFLKESTAQYSEFVERGKGEADYEDVLYAWAKGGDDVATLRRKTAEKYDLPAAAAIRVVDLTLERGALDSNAPRPPRLVTAFEGLARDYPQSDLILVEAARAVDDGSYGACNIDDLHRLIAGRADADAARVHIFDTVWCLGLLTERTTLRHGDTTSYLDMAKRSTELDKEWFKLAVLRIADQKIGKDAAVDEASRADVRKRRVNAEFDDGRFADGLAALPASPETWPALTHAFDATERRAIAAAHYLQGDSARARAWLATASLEEPAPAKEAANEKYEREARNYQLELLQRALNDPSRDDFAFLTRSFKLRSGLEEQMPVWAAVFERLAVAQRYPGLVDAPYARNVSEERQEALDKCYRCAPELTAAIERIAATYVSPQPLPTAEAGPQLPKLVRDRMERVLESPRPAWVEHAVPASLRTARASAKRSTESMEAVRLAAPPPQQREPPWMQRLPKGQLVRYVTQGNRIVAITASQSLDPTGEISAGGYWISVSDDAGQTFAPPLYTGLRMYEPYVVLPDSKVPIIDGDRLRLEVAVRKLDDKHVSLPPVRLPFLEQRDDVYVEATLEDLARDSDGDGLTDLAEWAMMLAPDIADTDGDGINDAADPLPHVAATARRTGADSMAAGLNKVFGDSLGAIITTDAADRQPGRTYALGAGTDAYNAASTRFMAAPPAYFAGLALKSRVIVLDPKQLDRLSKARGMSFVMGIEKFEVSHDGNTAIMVWSTGWAGGTYLIKRRSDGWDIEEIAGWIT